MVNGILDSGTYIWTSSHQYPLPRSLRPWYTDHCESWLPRDRVCRPASVSTPCSHLEFHADAVLHARPACLTMKYQFGPGHMCMSPAAMRIDRVTVNTCTSRCQASTSYPPSFPTSTLLCSTHSHVTQTLSHVTASQHPSPTPSQIQKVGEACRPRFRGRRHRGRCPSHDRQRST